MSEKSDILTEDMGKSPEITPLGTQDFHSALGEIIPDEQRENHPLQWENTSIPDTNPEQLSNKSPQVSHSRTRHFTRIASSVGAAAVGLTPVGATVAHEMTNSTPQSGYHESIDRSDPKYNAEAYYGVTYENLEEVSNELINPNIQKTWDRTDKPVADGKVSRTWMWGPELQAAEKIVKEPYTEAPGGVREVRYFDKSRMEITNPEGDQNSEWFVTNGLLVMEMIEGKVQVGDHDFVYTSPAEVNIVGDPDDPNGVTYASFHGTGADPEKSLLKPVNKVEEGTPINAHLDRQGNVTYNTDNSEEVTIGAFSDITGHNIAGPFWEFMNSKGLIYEDGEFREEEMFGNPFYATGLPVTEPYWTKAKVGGVDKEVLVQCFERRCLTYTPDNPAGWKVEAGNVGNQYYVWRYEQNVAPECPLEKRPFPETLGNIEDDDNPDTPDNLLIVNDACAGFSNGLEENRDFSEVAQKLKELHPKEKFIYTIKDKIEDVKDDPNAEEKGYNQEDHWWNSRKKGKTYYEFIPDPNDPEGGTHMIEKYIPLDEPEGYDSNQAALERSAFGAAEIFSFAYNRGNFRDKGQFDEEHGKAVDELFFDPLYYDQALPILFESLAQE